MPTQLILSHERYFYGRALLTAGQPYLEPEENAYNADGDRESRLYLVVDGDTLESIAFKVYGARRNGVLSQYYHAIGWANEIDDPFDLSQRVGQHITIPSIAQFEATRRPRTSSV